MGVAASFGVHHWHILPLPLQNLRISAQFVHYKYCPRLSPLIDSISLRISCARDLTGGSTSSSSSPRKGMVSANNTRYSSFSFSTKNFTILRPKIRDLNFSLRVCINTCNTNLEEKKKEQWKNRRLISNLKMDSSANHKQ